MISVPRSEETRVVPVGGPRHYPVKTCAERGWHGKVRVYPSKDYKCEDCGEWGDIAWAQANLRRRGDFLLELGEAIEDLARTQIREHRTIFDSDNEGLNQAASRAGGKQ
jgi:hypothetical protein